MTCAKCSDVLHLILRQFEEVSIKEMESCRFWKITEDTHLPSKMGDEYLYYSAVHHLRMTYPYINYIKYFKNSGYYYFGIRYNKDGEIMYLIYGIEGEKKETHQPYKGSTGFASWTPHGNSGVWLMYYNPFTGCVMLPKQKNKSSKKRK